MATTFNEKSLSGAKMTNLERLPSFHDANLVGFEWADDVIRLKFQLADNVHASLDLSGITKFRADGLQEGNIVDELRVFRGEGLGESEQAAREWIEYLVLGHELSADNPAFDNLDSVVRRLLLEIADGSKSLLAMRQIYGCEFVCIFQALQVHVANHAPA